jgi:hypothetical protein
MRRQFLVLCLCVMSIQGCAEESAPTRDQARDVGATAWIELASDTDQGFVIAVEVENPTNLERCVAALVPTVREAAMPGLVGYVWARDTSAQTNLRFAGAVHEGPVRLFSVPPHGARRIDAIAGVQPFAVDADSLEFGVSVLVTPCAGERTADGDYLWDGVQELYGGRDLVGEGEGIGRRIALEVRPAIG